MWQLPPAVGASRPTAMVATETVDQAATTLASIAPAADVAAAWFTTVITSTTDAEHAEAPVV